MPWTFAAHVSEFHGRPVIGVRCAGVHVAVYKLEAGIFATSDTCPHLGASLSAGCVVEHYIECPLHFALFDIRTGESDGSVTAKRVMTYPTKVEDDAIYVDVTVEEKAL